MVRRLGVVLAIVLTSGVAHADDEPAAPAPASAPADANETKSEPEPHKRNIVPVAPLESEDRGSSVEPKAVLPAPKTITFAADPIADGGIIIGAAAFAGILDLINGTGEIRPQQISSTFNRNQLLGIDRGAIDQELDSDSRTRSNIGLYIAVGYAVLDPILSGIREKSVQTSVVDGLIYAETGALTWGVTNLAKMAVRRPRPAAYIEAAKNRDDPNYSNADTDSALSFFSGHSATVAALSATATYLAFARSPRGARGWVTLAVGTLLTSFVAIERVRAGAHFPTDVIAGAIAGAGIGVIVPHLHRNEDVKQRRIWVGYAPERDAGGTLSVGGLF